MIARRATVHTKCDKGSRLNVNIVDKLVPDSHETRRHEEDNLMICTAVRLLDADMPATSRDRRCEND